MFTKVSKKIFEWSDTNATPNATPLLKDEWNHIRISILQFFSSFFKLKDCKFTNLNRNDKFGEQQRFQSLIIWESGKGIKRRLIAAQIDWSFVQSHHQCLWNGHIAIIPLDLRILTGNKSVSNNKKHFKRKIKLWSRFEWLLNVWYHYRGPESLKDEMQKNNCFKLKQTFEKRKQLCCDIDMSEFSVYDWGMITINPSHTQVYFQWNRPSEVCMTVCT